MKVEKNIGQDIAEIKNDVYEFIINHIQYKGYPPTVREIGECVDIQSTSDVLRYLDKLQRENKIKVTPKCPRGFKVIGYKFVKEESK